MRGHLGGFHLFMLLHSIAINVLCVCPCTPHPLTWRQSFPGPPRSSQGCLLWMRPLARSEVFLKQEKLPAVIAGSLPVLAPLSRSRDRASCPLVTTPVHHCKTSDVHVAFPGIS